MNIIPNKSRKKVNSYSTETTFNDGMYKSDEDLTITNVDIKPLNLFMSTI